MPQTNSTVRIHARQTDKAMMVEPALVSHTRKQVRVRSVEQRVNRGQAIDRLLLSDRGQFDRGCEFRLIEAADVCDSVDLPV